MLWQSTTAGRSGLVQLWVLVVFTPLVQAEPQGGVLWNEWSLEHKVTVGFPQPQGKQNRVGEAKRTGSAVSLLGFKSSL